MYFRMSNFLIGDSEDDGQLERCKRATLLEMIHSAVIKIKTFIFIYIFVKLTHYIFFTSWEHYVFFSEDSYMKMYFPLFG